jgi:hypothetical protein
MASSKSKPCIFFAQGICRNGMACAFSHEETSSTQSVPERCGSTSHEVRRSDIDSTPAPHDDGHAKPSQICRFFLQGSCSYGDMCRNQHPPSKLRSKVQLGTAFEEVKLIQENMKSPSVAFDSRSNVPCKFLSRPEGSQNSTCPYLHVQSIEDGHRSRDVELDEDEVSHRYFNVLIGIDEDDRTEIVRGRYMGCNLEQAPNWVRFLV